MAASQSTRVDRVCEACGTKFTARACVIKTGRGRYCSRTCTAAGQCKPRIERACAKCGKQLSLRPSTIKKGGGRYCSRECAGSGRESPFIERFRNHMGEATETGCIPWVGAHCRGYGTMTSKKGGHSTRANRLSYELFVGPIPEGLWVLHTCDNPSCVNPAHLFLGTPKENTHDMLNKGRQAKGKTHGFSKLTVEAVREIRERYAAGGVTQSALGSEYGVTQCVIWRVVRGKGWTHVA